MKNNNSGAPFSALGMVQSVAIANFRGFQNLEISDLAQINLIVGDNAVGKTALLEAIFLVLCNNPQRAFSLRQWRGMPIAFQAGSADSVVEGIYADLFHDPSSDEPITISLTGKGFENRKLVIAKTRGDIVIPTKTTGTGNRHDRRAAKRNRKLLQTPEIGESILAPISLTWTDQQGNEYVTHIKLSPSGLQFEGTGETIPICFLYAAQMPTPPEQAATFYSDLRKRRDGEKFKRVFLSAFDWITEISTDTVAGSPVLLADVPWAKQLLPLPALSGGTTRVASVLLALAQRHDGVVLVDEIEAGIYHARQARFAKGLVEMSRAYQSQLIMTTHSQEWIENFISALSDNDGDVAFWRVERGVDHQPMVQRFTVAEFSEGMAAGEMR